MVITTPLRQRRVVLSYGITNRHIRLARGYLGLTISWIERIELNFSAAFSGSTSGAPP
jgi:hypothetical protein